MEAWRKSKCLERSHTQKPMASPEVLFRKPIKMGGVEPWHIQGHIHIQLERLLLESSR